MAAKVTEKNREDTGFSDGSYPVSTHAQRMSAIKLRGHSPKHSKEQVLAHVARAASKNNDKVALEAVSKAREEDKK